MKKLKIISSILILASALTLNPIGVSAEWRQNSDGWWHTEGSSWTVGWKNINGEWYYFGNDGYMKTGWILDGGKWYYLNDSGDMASNTIIDGYYLSADGAWTQNVSIDNATTQNESNLEDFTMKTEKSVYPLSTDKIRVYITNNTNKESSFGARYLLERFENNEWHTVNSNHEIVVKDYSCLLGPKETNYDVIKLSDYRDDLTPGKYRIVKSIKKLALIAEFELKLD